eukprot:CAMPEP_0114578410 /NCGR_PEP_ID=MMETSP0125-20121206/2947_1 /TAXON_ID=485358 ORGANISM="Aristerostoma sp., Strain ATCC 50986" /NCGR_SAMPLE_ID=MMETSP0125 /ASSEMBLY_ACC=CAM_ASM_000245 /LENGTH=156 /DNA_ID=CAMNT_0001768447 /DNA_START=3310 /DNA_END=3780 /DNA_ORIENTATION=+
MQRISVQMGLVMSQIASYTYNPNITFQGQKVSEIVHNNTINLPDEVSKEVEDVSVETQELLNTNFCEYAAEYDWDCLNSFNGVSTRGIMGTIFYLRDIMSGFLTLVDITPRHPFATLQILNQPEIYTTYDIVYRGIVPALDAMSVQHVEKLSNTLD